MLNRKGENMSFPAEVRAEMGRQNLKPAALAEMSGVAEATISRKITREQRALTIPEALQIAEALNVPAWELMRRAAAEAEAAA